MEFADGLQTEAGLPKDMANRERKDTQRRVIPVRKYCSITLSYLMTEAVLFETFHEDYDAPPVGIRKNHDKMYTVRHRRGVHLALDVFGRVQIWACLDASKLVQQWIWTRPNNIWGYLDASKQAQIWTRPIWTRPNTSHARCTPRRCRTVSGSVWFFAL